ncbi:MAG: aminopeptidase N [Rickettsiella sp.]|nr:aminopeptidase N [Rickettsiella sp.]
MNAVPTTFLRDYSPPAFLIKAVDLTFILDEALTQVCAHLVLSRSADDKVNSPLILNGEELKLVSIRLNDRLLAPSDYRLDESKLIIYKVPNEFTLTIKTEIKPQENTVLSGLYVSRGIFCTQCEAEGFRRITYFADRPDVLARYTTTIIADKARYPILLSNGNKIAFQELENNRHSVTWEDPFKKPSYLFALVAGDLEFIQDEFITQSNRNVTLQIFFEKGQKEKCFHAMNSLKKAMQWDEQSYGREYDLDIFMIAVIDDFNMGAMENKGLNIFNAQTVLADPETATDFDYSYVTKVVGHEYFHNWTGNRITCRDWFQLSLKEGLTVFREQEFSESIGSPVIERINTVKQLRSLQFAEDAGPLAHPVQPNSYIEINNFYTTTIYEKGAELIRMMKILVGAELFRKGMDLYFDRHDGQAVTIEDFIQAIEEASCYDLQQFRLWYKQAGTPQLNIEYSYNSKLKTFDLTVKQSCPPTPNQPTKKPFCIPLTMALLSNQDQSIFLQLQGELKGLEKQRVLTITQTQQKFHFINVFTKPVPSLLRNFSAPVKLYVDYSDEDLSFLMQKDSDYFNRWNATQQLVTRIVMQRIKHSSIQSQSSLTLLLEAYQILMDSTQGDDALLAELLNLPSEAYFTEQMKIIDVDGIHRERGWLREQIADRLHKQLLTLYKTNQNSRPYSFDTQSQAQRRLKNTCLNYLMLSNDARIHNLCLIQYQKADNMTDSMSALSELVNNNLAESERLLNDFYEKWKNNTLVVCKWFALQARAPLPNSLERVKNLLKHSAFDWKNPNKIRSLIGVFSTENQVQFHQITGEGYHFLREKIQYLDKLNPQIAARLVKPLTRWQRFDRIRLELMRSQLEIIVKTPGLSPDVYEVVSKSLG